MSSSPVNQAVASPNPILDRQSPLPASVLQSSRPKAIGALVGFGIAVIINVCVFWEPPFAALVKAWILTTFAPVYEGEISPAYLLWCFLAIILSWFAAIAVHECGHAVVGACVGFRINSVRISRLEFHRPFRIAIYKGRGTGAGGWATMLLLKQDRIILRTVAMIFAGPGANLLSLALVLMLPLSRGVFYHELYSLVVIFRTPQPCAAPQPRDVLRRKKDLDAPAEPRTGRTVDSSAQT